MIIFHYMTLIVKYYLFSKVVQYSVPEYNSIYNSTPPFSAILSLTILWCSTLLCFGVNSYLLFCPSVLCYFVLDRIYKLTLVPVVL